MHLYVDLYSTEVADQIEYVGLTREIYEICGVASGGFCNVVCSSQ